MLEVERGLRGVWAGHRQLAAHRIWEVSAHSTVVLDGVADLSAICLVFLVKGHGALMGSDPAHGCSGMFRGSPGTSWHVLLCLCQCCLCRQRSMLAGGST